IAARVRVLDIAAHWSGAWKGADITDWAERGGGDPDRLCEIVAQLPPWTPEPYHSRFGAFTWGEPRPAGDGYDYLVKGVIPRREPVLIYGESQSGKSFFTFDLSMAIARGVAFQGRRVRRGLVVYCAVEAGTGFVTLRWPAYAQHHRVAADVRLPFVALTKR